MTAYLIPGVMGLLTGLILHWAGFHQGENLRLSLAWRRSLALRTGLTALGWGVMLTSLLMWLAVIDVDTVTVLPLSLGALLGGLLTGVLLGLCGFTPTTSFAGLTTGSGVECLCLIAGCCLGTLLLPRLDGLLTPLRTASPYSVATLFRVTLDEPYLLSGSFLGLACAGLLPVVMAICIPSPRPVIIELPEPPAEDSPEPAPDPESAGEEAVVIALEGEEPLVIDTELDEAEDAPDPEEAE